MEVDELELISHFLLFSDLVGSFDDLCGKGGLLVLILFDQCTFLPVLLLEELLNSLGLDIASAAVFTAHQDLTLKVIGIFTDFSNGHVCLF